MMQRIQVQEERGGKHVLYSRKRLALCVMFFCMLVVQMVWLGGTQEVYAQEAYQGFYYTYNGDGHDVYITITGYYGTEEKITIPSEIDGYKVRRIEGDAFGDCVSLTRVTIPEGVNEIGSYAFRGCSSLTSVTIPEGVTSIDGAFNGCSSLTSVTIPEGVTSIDGAFNGCSSLTSVTIPEGVTEIGGYAFYGCRSLASITIPEGVTEIGRDAFYGCRSLASVTIPEGVTSIGENAFSDCSSLTSVTIPEGLTEIGECAFFYCSSLTSVTIPEGVTSIGEKAFGWCSSLTSVTIPEGVAFIGEGVFSGCSSLASVTIPEGVTEIGRDAFYDCRSLTSVTIPESVTSIDEDAFSGCSLREIYYTGSKKQWDKINSGLRAACIHCSDGTIGFIYEITDGEAIITGYSYDEEEIQIPSRLDGYDVTGIGASAFRNCSNLANVTIPVSIKSIGESAFENCSGLTTVYYGNDWPDVATAVNSWNSISIGGGNNAIKEAVIHTGVYNKDFALFRSFQLGIYGQTVSIERYGGTETELTIPSEIHGYKVRTIGRNAFGGCSSLTSVTIPEGVTSIEGDAFLGCSSLRDVYYSGTKTQWNNFQLWLSDVAIHCSDETIGFIYEVIDGEAIITKYSSGEEEIQIPSRLGGYDVTGIGAFAFWNCSNLKSVTIPASIKSIGESAFENCSGLTIVNYGPDRWYRVEESINSWNSISMGDGNRAIKEAIIHARGYDKNFTFFHSFQLEIEGQTVSIEGYSGTETELTVPSEIRGYKVRRIGFQAFEDCVSLTRAEIPEGVTEIGRYAFSGCSSLTSVTIPKGVTSIWGAFSGCSSLASVTIPEGVTKIGGYAFSGCSLTSVTIPKSVTSIGSDAFASCSNLANIYYSGSMSQWREISSGFYDLKVPVHCSDGVITYTSTGGSEPYPVPSPDTDSDDNIDTYIDYPGTDLGGVLVKPGLPCIVNGFTISLVSFEWDSAYGIYELTLNAKNNTNHILPWQDIHYRSYKDENTLVQSSFIDLESLYPGENYTSLKKQTATARLCRETDNTA